MRCESITCNSFVATNCHRSRVTRVGSHRCLGVRKAPAFHETFFRAFDNYGVGCRFGWSNDRVVLVEAVNEKQFRFTEESTCACCFSDEMN